MIPVVFGGILLEEFCIHMFNKVVGSGVQGVWLRLFGYAWVFFFFWWSLPKLYFPMENCGPVH